MSTVDPRVERTRRLVLEATLDELASAGYGALTIEGIARRAGVGKATIYRHWNGKLDVVADAVSTLKQMIQPPPSDDHRARIEGLVTAVAEHLADSRYSACIPALLEASERDPAVREFHMRMSAERRAVLTDLIEAARVAGQLDPDVDVDLVADQLVGPLFLRRVTTLEAFSPERVPDLVAMVLDPIWRN